MCSMTVTEAQTKAEQEFSRFMQISHSQLHPDLNLGAFLLFNLVKIFFNLSNKLSAFAFKIQVYFSYLPPKEHE